VNDQARALVVCPSLGKTCGVAEYSRYTIAALAAAGWEARSVRTISQAADELTTEPPFDILLVQHEFGLWQRGKHPNGLSAGESTADLVAGMHQINSSKPEVRIGVICHTVFGGIHSDTEFLIDSGAQLYSLHRNGAPILGGTFLEHGVQSVDGYVAIEARCLGEPLTIGAFGMFGPTKGIRSAVELCRLLGTKLVACSCCRTDHDRRALREIVGDLDADVYDTFLSDREILNRLACCDILYLPQCDGIAPGVQPRVFSASGSVRLVLNLRRPVIVNRFWGYDELIDVLPIAESIDEAAAHVLEMSRRPEVYRRWVERIDGFVRANRLEDKILTMVAELRSAPPQTISIPVAAKVRELNNLPSLQGNNLAKSPKNEVARTRLGQDVRDRASNDLQVTDANAVAMSDEVVRRIPAYPGTFVGRGVVICAGGLKYIPSAWVLVRMLRYLGYSLPIEVWFRGDDERDESWMELVKPYGVECVDAEEIRRRHPHSSLGGWELKAYSVLHSRFREVMLLDADNVPVRDPTYLFETPEYRDFGAIFWPDGGRMPANDPAWQAFGVEYRDERSFESGQMLIDKARCWRTLNLCNWYNEQSHYYYRIVYGDKDTFRFAWHRLGQQFAMPERDMHNLAFTLLQYDPTGNLIFQHRCADKWLLTGNRRSAGFQHEQTCLEFIGELAARWNPVACQLQHLSNRDRAQMARIAERAYQYVLVGRRRWPIRLSPDGRVIGTGPLERYWWCRDGKLLFSRLDGREPTVLSAISDGSWRGRTAHYGGVDIRLVRTRREAGSAFVAQSGPTAGALEVH
jgi:hypothetical protein